MGPGRPAGTQWLCMCPLSSRPKPRHVQLLPLRDWPTLQAEPAARPPRGLPSTMTADDIEGTRPGWRPHTLFAAQPRDPLCVSDICPGPASRGGRGRGQRGADGVLPLRAASATEAGAGGTAGISAAALPMSARPFQQEEPAVPEYGVAFTVDWHKQRTEAKIRQGEAARQARAAADAAIAAAAAKAAAAARAGGGAGGGSSDGREAAGAVGLAGMMKSLRTFDREGCGRVQASEHGPNCRYAGLFHRCLHSCSMAAYSWLISFSHPSLAPRRQASWRLRCSRAGWACLPGKCSTWWQRCATRPAALTIVHSSPSCGGSCSSRARCPLHPSPVLGRRLRPAARQQADLAHMQALGQPPLQQQHPCTCRSLLWRGSAACRPMRRWRWRSSRRPPAGRQLSWLRCRATCLGSNRRRPSLASAWRTTAPPSWAPRPAQRSRLRMATRGRQRWAGCLCTDAPTRRMPCRGQASSPRAVAVLLPHTATACPPAAGGAAVEGQQGDAVPDSHAAGEPPLQAAPAVPAAPRPQRPARSLPACHAGRGRDTGSARAACRSACGDARGRRGSSCGGSARHGCVGAVLCRPAHAAAAGGICRQPLAAGWPGCCGQRPAAGGVSGRQERCCCQVRNQRLSRRTVHSLDCFSHRSKNAHHAVPDPACRPEANSSPLATGRAAQVAAREEVALLRSLS